MNSFLTVNNKIQTVSYKTLHSLTSPSYLLNTHVLLFPLSLILFHYTLQVYLEDQNTLSIFLAKLCTLSLLFA